MMPLRVAMPKSVMKPISDAIDNVPPAAKTIMTPPISASGRLAITSSASRVDRRRQIEEQKDSGDRHSCHDGDLPRRLFLGFELSTVLDEVALGKRHVTRDLLTDRTDHRAKISPCNVSLNDDSPLNIFAVDGVGTLIGLDG